MKLRQFSLHVIFPILIGGLLYILFRSKRLVMFDWFADVGLLDSIFAIRGEFNQYKSCLPDWIYFSLPDGLWTYAFSSTFLIVWQNDFKIARLWLIIPFLLGCVVEIAQGMQIFRGTFDLLDLAFSVVGILGSVLILKRTNNIL